MEEKFGTSEAKDLFEGILFLQTAEECRDFFRDLCTFSELKAMIERLQVAKRVNNGETYRTISKETGASSATVTRVAHWLHHGTGGYRLMLERMK